MMLAFSMMQALLFATLVWSEETSGSDSETCLLQLRADLGDKGEARAAQPEAGEKQALEETHDPRVVEKLTDPKNPHPPATVEEAEDEVAKEEAEMEAAEDAEERAEAADHKAAEEREIAEEHAGKHGEHTPTENHELTPEHDAGGAHGEHGEHEGHEGHDTHHHGEGIIGRQIGLMLVGAVTFQMALFYLVNNRDPDIRRYSWYTIGTTISIFCAVLVFEGLNAVLPFHDLAPGARTGIGLAHFLVWFVLTEGLLLYIALHWKDGSSPSDGASLKRSEAPLVLGAKCWGGLLAHVTAFAAIAAAVDAQFLLQELLGGTGVLLAPVLVAVVLPPLFLLAARVRNRIIMADGVATREEEVWEETAQEVENDVFSLSVAFLVARCVAYELEGKLHPAHDHGGRTHSATEISVSAAAAFVALLGMVTCHVYEKGLPQPAPNRRLLLMLQMLGSFTFAWCGLQAADWVCENSALEYKWTHVWAKVTLALVVSLLSVGVMFVADFVADLERTPPAVDAAIRDVVLSLGMLIGFSWEHAFALGLEDISADEAAVGDEAEMGEAVGRLIFSLFLVLVVFPAYRWYIAPLVFELEDANVERKRKEVTSAAS